MYYFFFIFIVPLLLKVTVKAKGVEKVRWCVRVRMEGSRGDRVEGKWIKEMRWMACVAKWMGHLLLFGGLGYMWMIISKAGGRGRVDAAMTTNLNINFYYHNFEWFYLCLSSPTYTYIYIQVSVSILCVYLHFLLCSLHHTHIHIHITDDSSCKHRK